MRAQARVDTSIAAAPALKPPIQGRRAVIDTPPDETADTPSLDAAPSQADTAPEDSEADQGWRATTIAADGIVLRTEPQAPRDGIIEVGEPSPVPDGTIDLQRDARTRADIAAFEVPPAGYNPYLFQIEPEPLLDRRTRELFRLEPYAAAGVRIGSFVLFPEAEVGAIATNNILRATPRHADIALEVGGSARAVSDWRVHALEFRASGLASFYDDFPSEDDRAYALEARGRVDVRRGTNVEVLVSHQLDKDVRSSPDSPVNAAERGDVETSRAAVAINQRFNRLALQLRGAITAVDYASVPSIGGGMISNDERDFLERETALRVSWALNRRAELFAEAGLDGRDFETAPADGILRSSTGERYRAGLSFGPLGATLRGEISAGWGRQEPNDPRLAEIAGLLIDANLAWRASALTTFLLTARSDFVDTTVSGSAGGLSHQGGLEIRHAFRRYLIGTAGVRLTDTPYQGISLTERELSTELGLEYYVGRDTILFGKYQHVAFDSTAPGSDYDADIVRIGVRVRR